MAVNDPLVVDANGNIRERSIAQLKTDLGVGDFRRPLVQVTASRNLARATDNQRHLYNDSGNNITLTLPASVLEATDEIEFAAIGSGSINVVAGSGVTISGAENGFIPPGGLARLKMYSASSGYLILDFDPRINMQVLKVSKPGGNTPITSNSFETIPFSNVDINVQNGWDSTNNFYRLPWSGNYRITVNTRWNEGTTPAGTGYYLAAHTANIDGSWGLWLQTNNLRNGGQVSRDTYLNANDPVRGYVYMDHPNNQQLSQAQMSIVFLRG